MATTTIKQRLFTQLLAQAESNAGASEETLPVLEQFIYGLCRENATREQADAAFAKLKDGFFDWNEIRVSTNREIEEVMEGLSDTESRAQRLISFLQEVFETEFTFDLEVMHKKGLKVAAKALVRYGASNDYVGAWVVQRTLGGHAIPVDAPTLRCARRLGIIDAEVEEIETVRATLEHLVPKTKNQAFTDAISEVAETYCWEGEPNCPACPLRADCPTGQEVAAEAVTAGRATRAKPR
jgi:endonuclease III